jgi:biopolymer transport protein ExbB
MDALRADGVNRLRRVAWCRQFLAVLLLFGCVATWTAARAAGGPADSSPAAKVENPAPDPAAEPQESLLGAVGHALGVLFSVIFLGLTVALVALAVANILAVRRDSVVPLSLVQGLESRLDDGRFQEACDLVRGDYSVFGRVLAAGLPHLIAGDAKAAAAMEEFGSLESIKMHTRLGYVWLIAQLAPLFGLLGTIDGLMVTFDTIVRKGASPRPFDLAGGIGTALVATAVGLWIAVVAVAFHQIVLGRVNRLLAEVGILAERFAERFAAARKP